MDWTPLIGPAVVAAVVSGAISVVGTIVTTRSAKLLHKERLIFDREQSTQKLGAEAASAQQRASIERSISERTQRTERYWKIQDRLTAFVHGRVRPDQIEEILTETRRLWLIAPPRVVSAMNDLVAHLSGESTDSRSAEEKLGAMVLAFREDLLDPRSEYAVSAGDGLAPSDFKVRSAAGAFASSGVPSAP